jgi:cell pole-organizing protein PopZ
MTQAAKAQEPSMEDILASIRRIIADDEGAKPAAKVSDAPPPTAARPTVVAAPLKPAVVPAAFPPAPPPEPEAMSQEDIDAMLAGFDTVNEDKPATAAPTEEPVDVLELTEAMEMRSSAQPANFRTIDADSDVVFTETADAEPAPAMNASTMSAPAEEASMPAPETERPLLSHHATAAVTSAFGTLAHTVLAQNARTLEDLVREMLRPMLKTWLDDNLPTIVERQVRAEIERVSRGRG